MLNADRDLPRPGGLYPSLRRNEVQHKANPESDSEKFTRRQASERARGKKQSNDRPDRSNGKPNRECPNHPFAVQRYLMLPDMPKRLAQRKKERTCQTK